MRFPSLGRIFGSSEFGPIRLPLKISRTGLVVEGLNYTGFLETRLLQLAHRQTSPTLGVYGLIRQSGLESALSPKIQTILNLDMC
jgi:hypothetical protein